MPSNKDKFEEDLKKLLLQAEQLEWSMLIELDSTTYEPKLVLKKGQKYVDSLPIFRVIYEAWYSECKALLKQVLPDRLADFVQHYEPPRRAEILPINYRVRDYLQGHITKIVGIPHALRHFQQQASILGAAIRAFKSSLFDIRQILQADLMDSEIETAEHLAKYKFVRAAGAIAGVVLERHLSEVCEIHSLNSGKKNPTINDFNELLKSNSTIDVPQWRFIQHLADIRNKCDHSKTPEPTQLEVEDLIQGVRKIIKTVF